ncbi:MAG: EAL domain-containing protein [Acidobacteria bacterium]|nr:EAL domain-containing protein [Acidobacteriota bacterium]
MRPSQRAPRSESALGPVNPAPLGTLYLALALPPTDPWTLGLLAAFCFTLFALIRSRRNAGLAQKALKDKKAKATTLERFADIALEDAEVGRWVWDLKKDKVEYSAGWRRMMRLEPDDLRGDLNDWFQRIHPNYLGEVKEAIAAHLEGKNPRFECDFRIQRGDGTYLWVLSRAAAHRDAAGKPEYLVGAQIDITAVVDVEKRVLHDAYIDKLTGLPNRRAFQSILERACEQSARDNFQFAVVFIDLDRFKQVNDSLGHGVGDELLAAVSARLNRQRRSGDTVARLGGDEFVALLGDIIEPEQAVDAAKRIHRALCEPFRLGRHEVYSGGSIGVAVSGCPSCDAETILRQADQAMYQAKTGKTGVALFSETMRSKASRELSMQSELVRAAERSEFQLYFQPIVDLRSWRIVSAEALLRWTRPDGERVRAAEFIPLAEELGLLGELGELALRMACTQRAEWFAQGFQQFRMAVNLGSLQLQKHDLAAHVESILLQSGLDPQLLEIETTESALIDSLHVASRNLARLDSIGVGLSLDDFGVGYASLSYLQRFPFQSVKVDRSVMGELEPGSKAVSLLRGMVTLAHSLDMRAVAEGVEAPAHLETLRELGFDRAQGFCLGRPMPAEQLTQLLAGEARMLRERLTAREATTSH